mgnify:CR=1 FL=1
MAERAQPHEPKPGVFELSDWREAQEQSEAAETRTEQVDAFMTHLCEPPHALSPSDVIAGYISRSVRENETLASVKEAGSDHFTDDDSFQRLQDDDTVFRLLVITLKNTRDRTDIPDARKALRDLLELRAGSHDLDTGLPDEAWTKVIERLLGHTFASTSD